MNHTPQAIAGMEASIAAMEASSVTVDAAVTRNAAVDAYRG
jgi:hypothetical protein